MSLTGTTALLVAALFFFIATAATEIYTVGNTLSLHDALPISVGTHRLGFVEFYRLPVVDIRAERDRKSTRLNSSHYQPSRMPSAACKKKTDKIAAVNGRLRSLGRRLLIHAVRVSDLFLFLHILFLDVIFFFIDTPTPEIYTVGNTLSLHDALPISASRWCSSHSRRGNRRRERAPPVERSEEHTSELQSLPTISYAVFCLKKKK